ncbi:hypothetical protein IL306_012957 [Fusarium sp. DS 682]|nr:hypothetical protein IL306_012957 [Fusarium sp. DS 682]
MAKSARASTRKANNRRLVQNVFGPAEAARNERLSAKLLELAKQPKPESSDVNMNTQEDTNDDAKEDIQDNEATSMDVDSKKPSSGRIEKKRADRRKQKSSKIVFKSYGGRKGKKKSS